MKINKNKWYRVAKIIAESDSIGEGYNYCPDYTKEYFNSEVAELGESMKNDYVINYAAVAIKILCLK